MIDYLTVMLANMVAGLFLLAWFLLRGVDSPERKAWAPAFAMVGLVATITGSHMTLSWPLPHNIDGNFTWANVAYGELMLLFGTIFLGAALATAMHWSLKAVGAYAFIAAALVVLVGIRIMTLGLSASPAVTGTGFIITGVAGMSACLSLCAPSFKLLRLLAAMLLIVASLAWAVTAAQAYWGHLEMFSRT